jgi:hypothetical protein
MRRYGIAVMLIVVFAATAVWADVPDPDQCEVANETGMQINADPYDHEYGLTAAERYQDVVVTLYTESSDPVEGYVAADFSFVVNPHPSWPSIGGGAGGTCPDCHLNYTVTCQDAETNALGEMTVRVEIGPECAPSFCCPVAIDVVLTTGTIPDPIIMLMNSFDLVANGDVRGPDFASFSTYYNGWTGSAILSECADFVWVLSPTPQGSWGEVTGSDFAAFSTAYKDCCGFPKEDDPGNCLPFTNVCP